MTGPILCDVCGKAALAPWHDHGRVLCPNCLLRRISDAIRERRVLRYEPVAANGDVEGRR